MLLVGRIIGSFIALSAFLSLAVAEEIKISSGKTVIEMVFNKMRNPFEKETGIKLTIVKPSQRIALGVDSADYIWDLVEGKADVATVSGSFEQMLEGLKKRNLTLPNDITHRVIGYDTMEILVNKQSKVSKATIEQLADIFTGKIKNWKALGGADLPISISTYANKTGKNLGLRKLVMKDSPFGGTVKEVAGEEDDLAKEIASTPGAIGYKSLSIPLPDDVQILETPTIGRPITMFSRGQPTPAIEKLINFIRNYNQKTKN
jgi:phosphate transport system substrate-binding protein